MSAIIVLILRVLLALALYFFVGWAIFTIWRELRAIRGRYVLFDLNSTGGTFVNGQRITQFTLRPGDVISLAGVTIIYGEETTDVTAANGNTSILPSQPNKP